MAALTAVVLTFLAAFPHASHAGESELKVTTMEVAGQLVTLVKYREEHFNKVPLSALEKPQWKNRLICVEGKFDQVVANMGNIQVFRLVDSDINFLYPPALGMLGLIRGDNVWVGGVAESEIGKETLRVKVRGIVKLPNDMELFRKRYSAYSKSGNWRELISLGDWIGNAGKLAPSFKDLDAYRSRQRRAYRKALEVYVKQIAQDDAEGHYAIAVKYLELLDDSISAQRHLKKCLQIDPTHRAAREKLLRFGYVLFEGTWMAVTERERILKKRQETAETVPAIDTTGTEGPVQVDDTGETGPSTAQRLIFLSTVDLAAEKDRIRRLALTSGRPEITVFVDEAGKAKDPRLAVYIMGLLALRHEEPSLDGISVLRALVQEDVLKSSFEVLVWRPEERAFDMFLAALEDERNAEVLRCGFDLLAQTELKRACPALIRFLESESFVVRGEAQHRLQRLTGERFETPAEWRSWWEKSPH